MSGLLTVDMVEQAMPIVKAAHNAMLKRGMLKRPHLLMVVLDPTKPYFPNADPAKFNDIVLYECEFTPRSEWESENPYDMFALQKASVSWRTGMSSRIIRECAPHLLEKGNTVHGGSVVCDRLITACSGAQPWHDETLAGIANSVIRGIANEKMQMEILPSGRPFIR